MALLSKRNSFFSYEDDTPEYNGSVDVSGSGVDDAITEEITLIQQEKELDNDIASVEEDFNSVDALEEQMNNNQELLDNNPEAITPEVVTESNKILIYYLGKLGYGYNQVRDIKIGTESIRMPIQNLQVAQEDIGQTIKEFFAKIWNFIKDIFTKIIDWFKNLFGATKKKEEVIAQPVKLLPYYKPEEVNVVVEEAIKEVVKEETKNIQIEQVKKVIDVKVKESDPVKKKKKVKDLSGFILNFLKSRADLTTPVLLNHVYGTKIDYKDMEIFATSVLNAARELLKTPGNFQALVERVAVQQSKFNKAIGDKLIKKGGWNPQVDKILTVNIPLSGADSGIKNFNSIEFVVLNKYEGKSENMGLGSQYSIFNKQEQEKMLINMFQYGNFLQAQKDAGKNTWSNFIKKTQDDLNAVHNEVSKIIKDYEDGKIDLSSYDPNKNQHDGITQNHIAYFKRVQSLVPYGMKQVNFACKLVNSMCYSWYAFKDSLSKLSSK